MTPSAFAAIVDTIVDKWQGLYSSASPFDIFQASAVHIMPTWIRGAIPGIRLTRDQVWEIGKAVKARSDGLKSAERMVARAGEVSAVLPNVEAEGDG